MDILAELEQAVIEGMHFSFDEKRELMEKDLIKAVSELIPLSRTAKEQIDLLKQWSSQAERAQPHDLLY